MLRSRQVLLRAYAAMEMEDLARCFAAAFLCEPGTAFLAGVELVVAAHEDAARLAVTDRLRKDLMCDLGDNMNRIVRRACARVAQHQMAWRGLDSNGSAPRRVAPTPWPFAPTP